MPLAEVLRQALPGLKVQEPLSKHTTLCVGGPADYYADVNNLPELITLKHLSQDHHLPVFFLGAGSNLLVSDDGIRGLVLHLQGDFKKIDFNGRKVHVGAGVMMPTLSKQAAEKGLGGVEALIGVPGTVGGGLVMNAGTREGWIGQVVRTVEFLGAGDPMETRSQLECTFHYRHSNLEGLWLIGAHLELFVDEPRLVTKRMEALLQHRTKTQPLTTANCGSVFKNPVEGPAAQWIEKAGLKGMVIGGARVSDRHANFIVTENAKAKDVLTLIQHIQETVQKEFGVTLQTEVKLAGAW